MTATARRPADDPLHIYDDGLVVKGRESPVPLVATRFAVTITGPVVAVRTWRSFRNAEAHSIEVTLTMPNIHNILVDLKPFGQDNSNEIFMPISDPSGYIHARVTRD